MCTLFLLVVAVKPAKINARNAKQRITPICVISVHSSKAACQSLVSAALAIGYYDHCLSVSVQARRQHMQLTSRLTGRAPSHNPCANTRRAATQPVSPRNLGLKSTRRQSQHTAMLFSIGDIVEVRKHGRATVVEGPRHDPGNPDMHGRFKIRYHEDGTTFWVTPERLRRMELAQRRIVVAYHTSSYRQAAIHNTERLDVCLEIGCHAGVTTHTLSKRCQAVIGVDLSHHAVQAAREKYPGVRFEQLDGNDVEGAAALLAATGHAGWTKILCDISGQAPLSVLLPLLQRWLTAAPQATLVVKNRALHCAVSAAERQGAARLSPAVTTTSDAVTDNAPSEPLSNGIVLQGADLNSTGQDIAFDKSSNGTLDKALNGTLDEVVALLLGQGGAEDQRQQLLQLLNQCETFKDPGFANSRQFVVLNQARAHDAENVFEQNPGLAAGIREADGSVRVQESVGAGGETVGVVVPRDTAAVLQASKVAKEAADKEARKQAKAQRRAARKAAGLPVDKAI